MTNAYFPWQKDLWEFLLARYQKKQLPQALLLEGNKGIGKMSFAKAFAKLLLCQAHFKNADNYDKNPSAIPAENLFITTTPCEKCHSCRLFKAGTHPDFNHLFREGTSQTIKIDQIRSLNEKAFKTAHCKGYRVSIIEAAHTMNQAASNAFLKTLEEPPPYVIFILVTDNLYGLSATIRSRCERVRCTKPDHDSAMQWLEKQCHTANKMRLELLLQLAQGAPLEAKTLLDDLSWRDSLIQDFSEVLLKNTNPLGLSEKYKSFELKILLFWLKTMTMDLIRLKAGLSEAIMHIDQKNLLTILAAKMKTIDLFAYLDKLYALTDTATKGLNLNHGLVVDNVFLAIHQNA